MEETNRADLIEALMDLEEQLNPVDEFGYVWFDGYGYPIAEEGQE